MKKKILCLFLAVLALVCLHTAALAAESVDQILAPIGAGYTDLDGNFILDADDEFVVLTAEFADKSDVEVEWCVLDGKDIVSITKREGYGSQAIMKALSDGEATIMAYLEDDSQSVITGTVLVSGQTVETDTVATLSVSAEGDGNVTRKTASGTTLTLGSTYTNQHEIGMEVDLTAVVNNMPFKYWVVRHGLDSEVIVSRELNYKFILTADTTVAAVFDRTGASKGINATFLHENFVALNTYVKSLAQDVPAAPYRRNMNFVKWTSEQVDADSVVANGKLENGELTVATTFTATYAKKDVSYNITVVGGSGSGTYAYGAPVSAKVTAEAQTGKTFLFWSKDGMPVSYDTEYKFSAMQDCTVTAVFGAEVETDGINMVMQAPVEDGDAIAFTFERYVPEKYTFITSGFVVGTNAECAIGDADNYMETVSHRNGVRTQLTKSLTKQSGVTTYYARGYVVYKVGDVIKTIYSAPQKFVLE